MSKRLKDVKIEEVSLVKSPANKRRFLFYKDEFGNALSQIEDNIDRLTKVLNLDEGGIEMEELRKELASFLQLIDVELEDEEEIAKMSESAKNALVGALNILKKYIDDFPEDIKKAIKVIAKYIEAYPYPYPEKEVKKDDEQLESEVNKSEEEVEKEGNEEFEKIGRKLSKGVEAKFRELVAEGRKLFDSLSKLIDDLVGMEDEMGKSDEVKKEDVQYEELLNSYKDIVAKLEKLEKQVVGGKKSLDVLKNEEVKKDDNDPFPSISRFFEEV